MTALLETDIIVICHAIETVDLKALRQKESRQMIADEPSCPGDQNPFHV